MENANTQNIHRNIGMLWCDFDQQWHFKVYSCYTDSLYNVYLLLGTFNNSLAILNIFLTVYGKKER